VEELLGELGRTGREGRRLSFDVLEEFGYAAGGDRIDLMPQLLHQKESVRLSAIFFCVSPFKRRSSSLLSTAPRRVQKQALFFDPLSLALRRPGATQKAAQPHPTLYVDSFPVSNHESVTIFRRPMTLGPASRFQASNQLVPLLFLSSFPPTPSPSPKGFLPPSLSTTLSSPLHDVSRYEGSFEPCHTFACSRGELPFLLPSAPSFRRGFLELSSSNETGCPSLLKTALRTLDPIEGSSLSKSPL